MLDLPCHFLSDLGLFNPVRPAFTPPHVAVRLVIPLKGELDDVNFNVLGFFLF